MEGFRNRDKSFGNARYAISIVDEAKMNLGLRLMKRADLRELDADALSVIEKENDQGVITIEVTNAASVVTVVEVPYNERSSLLEIKQQMLAILTKLSQRKSLSDQLRVLIGQEIDLL